MMFRRLARAFSSSSSPIPPPHPEQQYLGLIRNVLENGEWIHGRNGRTKELFGASMRFSLENNTFPLLTTKRVPWKTCLRELLWFVRGSTDNRELNAERVHIWDANGTRAFLDSRGLTHYEENELGPIYGYQWRSFNKPYVARKDRQTTDQTEHHPKHQEHPDQLNSMIASLCDPEKRHSRRLILSAWNPCQLDEMALPPCHILAQFHVDSQKGLSCSMYQRSADIGLGMPFNIASYSFLTCMLAHHCGLVPHEFVYFIGNAHVYESHVDTLRAQVLRTPFEFPTLTIDATQPTRPKQSIEDYTESDFTIHGYKHHAPLRMNMVA